MNKLVTWDEETIARLVELWPDHTGSQIVEIFSTDGIAVTRNAVVGKINRLGLSIKNKTKIDPRTRTSIEQQRPRIMRNKDGIGAVVRRINQGPKIAPEEFKSRSADVVSLRKPILELMAMECRWADEHRNESGLHTFCGNPTLDGASYCESHRELSRGVGTSSERSANRVSRAAA